MAVYKVIVSHQHRVMGQVFSTPRDLSPLVRVGYLRVLDPENNDALKEDSDDPAGTESGGTDGGSVDVLGSLEPADAGPRKRGRKAASPEVTDVEVRAESTGDQGDSES